MITGRCKLVTVGNKLIKSGKSEKSIRYGL